MPDRVAYRVNERDYRRREIAAWALFWIAAAVYVALTLYFGISMIGSYRGTTEDANVAYAFTAVLFMIFGSSGYAAVFILIAVALALVNIRKPSRGFRGVVFLATGAVALLTELIFFMILLA